MSPASFDTDGGMAQAMAPLRQRVGPRGSARLQSPGRRSGVLVCEIGSVTIAGGRRLDSVRNGPQSFFISSLEDHDEVRLSMPLCGLGNSRQTKRRMNACAVCSPGEDRCERRCTAWKGLSNSRVRHGSHSSRFCWSCQERWCSPERGVLRRSAPLPSRLVRPRFCSPT